MEQSLFSNYLFYLCFSLNWFPSFTRKGETLQLSNLVAVLYHCKIVTLLQSVVFILLWKAMITQSLLGEICARGILTYVNYNLNIIAYHWSLEYCSEELFGGQFPYLEIQVTFSVGKKLQEWSFM